jgi:hypothetical protein
VRRRWHVAFTLVRNPELVFQRKAYLASRTISVLSEGERATAGQAGGVSMVTDMLSAAM